MPSAFCFQAGSAGGHSMSTTLRDVQSMTQTALMPVACANMRFVEPSGFAEGHRPHFVVPPAALLVAGQFHAPHHRVGHRVDHLNRRVARTHRAAKAGDNPSLVRRDVGVVHSMMDGNAANQLVRVDVDHVDHRHAARRHLPDPA